MSSCLDILEINLVTFELDLRVATLMATRKLTLSLHHLSLRTPPETNIAFLVARKITNNVLLKKAIVVFLCEVRLP